MRRLGYLAFFLFASFDVMEAVGDHSVLTTDYCVGERTIGFLSGEREAFVFSYFRREHPDKVFRCRPRPRVAAPNGVAIIRSVLSRQCRRAARTV
jgi:hypothetical protein